MKIKAALIVDNLSLTEWQRRALEDASEYLDISLVLNCQNTRNKKRLYKHFAYYVLNVLSLKNDLSKTVSYQVRDEEILNFNSVYNGMWQSIPADVADKIKSKNIKLVIKFGMSLLKINEPIVDLDILSFHHGDPEYYRGRPAGFYELYQHADRVGLIVQKLTNELDSGKVLARIHSKIYHHSYKKTARNFFSNSEFLLRKSLKNYLSQQYINIPKFGPNYRLPSNAVVIKFALKLFYRKVSRLFFGALVEKRWNIVKLEFTDIHNFSNISVKKGKVPTIKPGYTFYADPFFNVNGDKIRVEALNSKNGLGEIVEIDAKSLSLERTILKGSHFSYPYSFQEGGIEYVMPEVATHSFPFLLKKPFDMALSQPLDGLKEIRLIDGSLIQHNGMYYLFGGLQHSCDDNLYLYFSKNLNGPYKKHPQNPIVMDPKSARMGGRIYFSGEKIYRFGQNNCYRYGNQITVIEIEHLTPEMYSEKNIGYLAFDDAKGPHTIDVKGNAMVLDFYLNKFSLLAGYRRFASKLFG